jgi:type IV pilus assembly protein PilB
MRMMKKRLGDILQEMGAVDALQLQSALAYQRKWGVPLGQVVSDMRFCRPEQVLQALSLQAGIPPVDLDAELLDVRLGRLVPQRVAEMHRVVPLRVEGPRETVLVVAVAAPATLYALDAVQKVSGKLRVEPRLATDAAISRAIERLYRSAEVPRRPLEAITLPEAEEEMAFQVECMASLTEGGRFDDSAWLRTAPRVEVEGLPMLKPLEVEVPEATARAERARPVLVYGWGAEAAAGLMGVLKAEGHAARMASTAEVLAADERAVVVAPLPALEALGRPLRAQVLAAGKVPEQDVHRAQTLGARGFLAAPVDPDLMLRAVRRLLGAGVPRLRATA